jgi:DNA-binding transcriptional ArsR family regulator
VRKRLTMSAENVDEDRRRAEIFDALSHPTRILILKALNEGSLGFADLKKKLGIESSGHLQHHINKLNGLIRTDDYGKYTLSDQGRDALYSVETVEKVTGSEANKNGKTRSLTRNIAMKASVITLAILLVLSSAIAAFEYRNTSSLQSVVSERDNTLVEHGKVTTWIDTALNLTQMILNIKPPNASQYLTTLPDSNNRGMLTKIFLLFTAPGYTYDPYPWPLSTELRNALNVPTDNGSIRLPDFGWDYLPGEYSHSGSGDPILMVGVTVRNDYTPNDAGSGLIGNRLGSYASYINLAVQFYGQDGNVVQGANATGIPAPLPSEPTGKGGVAFQLGSGQTKQIVFYFSPSGLDINVINRYEIYVTSLSAY